MFASEKNGARCLEDYQDIRKGAWVPTSNELYAQVETWLESNDWQEIPEGFFDVELTAQQQIDELEASISKRNEQEAILGDEYALNKIAEVRAQIAVLREQL